MSACTATAPTCALHACVTSADVDDLFAVTYSPQFGYDLDEGHDMCEAVARALERSGHERFSHTA